MSDTIKQARAWSEDVEKRLISVTKDEDSDVRSVAAEAACCLIAMRQALDAQVQPEAEHHFDDHAVDCFAKMMKEKLKYSREVKGRDGWDDPEQCSVEYLNELLLEHVAKGDPVDVANLCMMLTHYQAKITIQPETFDTWINNPYTKVLQKSVDEDYVPKHAAPVASAAPVQPSSKPDAHELWTAAQLVPGEGIEDGVMRIESLLTRCATSSKEASDAQRKERSDAWARLKNPLPDEIADVFDHPAVQPCQGPEQWEIEDVITGKKWVTSDRGEASQHMDGNGSIIATQVAQPCRNSRDDAKISRLGIAGLAVKHFGNPIPPAAYAFADDLLKAGLSQPCQSMSDAEFLSKRLARVAKLAGVSMPDMPHEKIAEVAGTILGEIARKLAAQSEPAQTVTLTKEQILAAFSSIWHPREAPGNCLLERVYPGEVVAVVRRLLSGSEAG